jgi:hypothetical protein
MTVDRQVVHKVPYATRPKSRTMAAHKACSLGYLQDIAIVESSTLEYSTLRSVKSTQMSECSVSMRHIPASAVRWDRQLSEAGTEPQSQPPALGMKGLSAPP